MISNLVYAEVAQLGTAQVLRTCFRKDIPVQIRASAFLILTLKTLGEGIFIKSLNKKAFNIKRRI